MRRTVTIIFEDDRREEVSTRVSEDDFLWFASNSTIVGAACSEWLREHGLEWTCRDAIHASAQEQQARKRRN